MTACEVNAAVRDSAAAMARALAKGDRHALAKAITVVESTRNDDRAVAAELLNSLQPASGHSIRVGISGAPGVGKSTFIEALGNHVIDAGFRVAVLAVDPSSATGGGSILGDKTRMETLARRSEAFIRPSPASNELGGVTRRSRESLLLCEAAGYDVVLVETVGVGQSETRVADMTDMFLLMLLPGSGDELQGIKRGIMELADLVVVNKADGELTQLAERAAGDCERALQFLSARTTGWKVSVKACSALEGSGIAAVWETIQQHDAFLRDNGSLAARRLEQARSWMWSDLKDGLIARLSEDESVAAYLHNLEAAFTESSLLPPDAADRVLHEYRATIADTSQSTERKKRE